MCFVYQKKSQLLSLVYEELIELPAYVIYIQNIIAQHSDRSNARATVKAVKRQTFECGSKFPIDTSWTRELEHRDHPTWFLILILIKPLQGVRVWKLAWKDFLRKTSSILSWAVAHSVPASLNDRVTTQAQAWVCCKLKGKSSVRRSAQKFPGCHRLTFWRIECSM